MTCTLDSNWSKALGSWKQPGKDVPCKGDKAAAKMKKGARGGGLFRQGRETPYLQVSIPEEVKTTPSESEFSVDAGVERGTVAPGGDRD